MFYPDYYFNFDAMDVEGYIYSDPHFGHKNIITYESRPFADVAEMNDKMLQAINDKITTPNSILIVGGDMFMNRKDVKKYQAEDRKMQKSIVDQIMPAVVIAKGNHDDTEDFKMLPSVLVAEQLYFKYNGRTYWLAHAPDPLLDTPAGGTATRIQRPTATYPYDVALCGHVHSQWLNNGPYLNVGADLCAYTPRSLAELEAVCKEQGLIK